MSEEQVVLNGELSRVVKELTLAVIDQFMADNRGPSSRCYNGPALSKVIEDALAGFIRPTKKDNDIPSPELKEKEMILIYHEFVDRRGDVYSHILTFENREDAELDYERLSVDDNTIQVIMYVGNQIKSFYNAIDSPTANEIIASSPIDDVDDLPNKENT